MTLIVEGKDTRDSKEKEFLYFKPKKRKLLTTQYHYHSRKKERILKFLDRFAQIS